MSARHTRSLAWRVAGTNFHRREDAEAFAGESNNLRRVRVDRNAKVLGR